MVLLAVTSPGMSNPQVGELFVTAAQETRDDLEQTALRLFARATDRKSVV